MPACIAASPLAQSVATPSMKSVGPVGADEMAADAVVAGDALFGHELAQMDLIPFIGQAREMGMHEPTYPLKDTA